MGQALGTGRRNKKKKKKGNEQEGSWPGPPKGERKSGGRRHGAHWGSFTNNARRIN